uniref:Protein FAM169B-like n=1 Tax=Haplochromis burtoni TaxID=8153 RepID=A0A3Q3CBG8_HAPBU
VHLKHLYPLQEAMYPVDLPSVDHNDLTSASEQYMSSLESSPCDNEWFQSSQTSKVPNHIWVTDYYLVGLYLHGKWWLLDDVLRTSSKSRSGLVSVQSVMERVIVFLLSQVMERPSLFSLHPPKESCKVLWKDNQAVGFYTVKHKGSLCDGWSSCCYLLPVLDTVLVRRSCRRRGFGLQMLEDFCSSFSTEEFLGVSSPLSPMFKRFLQKHQQYRERLYEVEAPGGWTQRRNIWLNIHTGVNTAVVLDSAEQQFKSCEPSQGRCSLSSELPGTGCSPAAQTIHVQSGPPTRLLNTAQALKSKASKSTKHHREEPEDMQKIPKRARSELKHVHTKTAFSSRARRECSDT